MASAQYVDPAAKRVVVTTDTTVSAGEVATIKRVAGPRRRGHPSSGYPGCCVPCPAGDAIYGSRYRCPLGFNVVKGEYVLPCTAGHWRQSEAKNWYTAAPARRLSARRWPEPSWNDYALVPTATSRCHTPAGSPSPMRTSPRR